MICCVVRAVAVRPVLSPDTMSANCSCRFEESSPYAVTRLVNAADTSSGLVAGRGSRTASRRRASTWSRRCASATLPLSSTGVVGSVMVGVSCRVMWTRAGVWWWVARAVGNCGIDTTLVSTRSPENTSGDSGGFDAHMASVNAS